MNLKQKIYNLLRWSEKYTQTDMIYLAKGGFWLTLGQITSSVSEFLLAIAFANLIPKETYGTYRYVLSLGSILAIPTLFGMNTAIVRTVARGYEGSFIPALKTRLRWGILGVLAGLGLAGYYFLNGNITLTICFLIAAVFLPLMNSFTIYESFLGGKKRFDIQSKYNITLQILTVGTLIITLSLTKNLFLILFAYFVSHTLLRFIFLQITIKKAKFSKEQDPKAISYGKHLSLMGTMELIAKYLDKVLIWHFLGAPEVAIYSFARTPIRKIQELFGKTMGPLALPKFSKRTVKELKATLPKKILKLFLLVIPIIGLYIIFIPYIYEIIFPQYLDSIKYTRVLAFILLSAPLMFLGTSLEGHAKKKEMYIYKSIGNIVYIVLLIILLPLYKIWGVVFATLLFYLINSILLIVIFKKIH